MSGIDPAPPPGWARRLVRVLLPPEDRDPTLAELAELHRARSLRHGPRAASRWYRRQALRFAAVLLRERVRRAFSTAPWRTRGVAARSLAPGAGAWDAVRHDLGFALRQIVRRPGGSLVAVVVLALGIGSGTAVFSLVDAVLLRPLPFPDPERLVRVSEERIEDAARSGLSPPSLSLWSVSDLGEVEALAAFSSTGLDLVGAGEPVELQVATVGHEFFPVLGVAPALGRTLLPSDDRLGAPAAVVLSHALWTSRFGRDPSVVGRALELGGSSWTVVGVMPAGFAHPAGAQAWVPLRPGLDGMEEVWGARFLEGVARLREGATPEGAAAELSALLAAVPEASGYRARLDPLQRDMTGAVRRPLVLLLAAVLLVIVGACTNVGGLLLARALGRRREVAVRAALGAGRARIVSAFLAESLVLASLAGVLGAATAWIGLDALLALAPLDLPRAGEVGMDGRVLAFAIGVTLATGALAGALPAWRVGPLPGAALGRVAEGGPEGERARAALVVVQVGVTVVLLAAAGLLARSFVLLLGQDRGFRAEGVVAVDLSLPEHRFPGEEGLTAAYDELLRRAAEVPGVEAVALSRNLPFAGRRLSAPVYPADERERLAPTVHVSVTPGYFETLGSRVVRGRALTREDESGAHAVALVSETLARSLFGAEDPIGRDVVTMMGGDQLEVVGVVEDVRFASLAAEPERVLYRPLTDWPSRGVHLVVRSGRPTAALAPALLGAVRAVHAGQPVREIVTLEALVGRSVARPRFHATLLAAFAGCTLFTAALGLYGLLAGLVAQRRRGIGIRMALGADAADVRWLVVRRALLLTLAGTALGMIGALAAGRLLEGMLFGIEAGDPATLAAVVTLLLLTASVASWGPARRATRVDPLESLRET